jgi:prepilin peptidase CpaA
MRPLVFGAVYSAMVVLAGVTDVRSRRVPNGLVVALAVVGWAWSVVQHGPVTGTLAALSSGGVGLLLWLPCWLLGMLGAGDVKLFGAGSLWLPLPLVWRAAVLAALLGGVLAAVALGRRGVPPAASPPSGATAALPPSGETAAVPPVTLPYAVPMAVALLVAWWRPVWLGG